MSSVRTLILTPDNPCNTTITDEQSGETIYQVHTEHGKDTITFVKTASGEEVASWVWRDVRADEISFKREEERVPLSSVVKKSLVPFNSTLYMKDPSGKEYKFKGNEPGRSLEVFLSSDPTNALARLEKSHRIKDQAQHITVVPAKILLDARGQEMEETIVPIFMALEKKRRARENGEGNRADVLGAPPYGAIVQ